MALRLLMLLMYSIGSCNGFLDADISPKRRAFVVGESVEFKCVSTTEDYDSSNLMFSHSSRALNLSDIVIVDKVTISLTLTSLTWNDTGTLYCKGRHENHTKVLNLKKIAVGYPPSLPTDLECISEDDRCMLCHVKYSLQNVVLYTDVAIEYTCRAMGWQYRSCYVSNWTCDLKSDVFFPLYDYKFRVNISNAISMTSTIFTVRPNEHVKPNGVGDLAVNNISSSSFNITWTDTSKTSADFIFVVDVTSEFHSQTIQVERNYMYTSYSILVKDLTPYADVKVIVLAVPFKGYNSSAKSITFRMQEDVSSPPLVPKSAFSIIKENNSRNIVLYWQEIPRMHQHGLILGFEASVIHNGTTVYTQYIPSAALSTLITYHMSSSHQYVIVLKSKNTKGLSPFSESSQVIVEPEREGRSNYVHQVETVSAQNDYDIYWSIFNESNNSTYWVHWCYGERSTYVECLTSINTRKSDKLFIKSLTVPDVHHVPGCSTCKWQIGVSMETDGVYSGIVWSSCSFVKYKAPIIISLHITNVTSIYATLTWTDACSYGGRADFHEVGVGSGADSRTACTELKETTLVQASHFAVIKTHSFTDYLCVRAGNRHSTGTWHSKRVQPDHHGTQDFFNIDAVIGITMGSVAVLMLGLCVVLRQLRSSGYCEKMAVDIPHVDKDVKDKNNGVPPPVPSKRSDRDTTSTSGYTSGDKTNNNDVTAHKQNEKDVVATYVADGHASSHLSEGNDYMKLNYVPCLDDVLATASYRWSSGVCDITAEDHKGLMYRAMTTKGPPSRSQDCSEYVRCEMHIVK